MKLKHEALTLPEDLPEDARAEIEQAFEAWKDSKDNERTANEIVDAYVVFSDLMRKHVDVMWS